MLLFLLPLLVVLAGRQIASSSPLESIRLHGAIWTALALAGCLAAVGVEVNLKEASQLVLWEAVHWATWCLCAAALANTHALLTRTGQLELRWFVMVGVLVSFLLAHTYGLVAGLMIAQGWLMASQARSKSRLPMR
jgi:hypothetical protein